VSGISRTQASSNSVVCIYNSCFGWIRKNDRGCANKYMLRAYISSHTRYLRKMIEGVRRNICPEHIFLRTPSIISVRIDNQPANRCMQSRYVATTASHERSDTTVNKACPRKKKRASYIVHESFIPRTQILQSNIVSGRGRECESVVACVPLSHNLFRFRIYTHIHITSQLHAHNRILAWIGFKTRIVLLSDI
jgi:hypothetical protein